jgi:protein-histidine N-methyltransferase
LILTWALSCASSVERLQGAFIGDEELELTPEVLLAFQSYLSENQISLSFASGAWSVELVDLLYNESETLSRQADDQSLTLVLGAETIYSPFALKAFLETVFEILQREAADPNKRAAALIGAKRLYFGVGGSLDDFIQGAKAKGGLVTELREETDGVRRGVVRCALHE